jgi:hypothetical protein
MADDDNSCLASTVCILKMPLSRIFRINNFVILINDVLHAAFCCAGQFFSVLGEKDLDRFKTTCIRNILIVIAIAFTKSSRVYSTR